MVGQCALITFIVALAQLPNCIFGTRTTKPRSWVSNDTLKPTRPVIDHDAENWSPMRTFSAETGLPFDILALIAEYSSLLPLAISKAHLEDSNTRGPFNPTILLQMLTSEVDMRRNQQRLFLFICGYSQDMTAEDVQNVAFFLKLADKHQIYRLRTMIMAKKYLQASNTIDSVKEIASCVDNRFRVRKFQSYTLDDARIMDAYDSPQSPSRKVIHFALSLHFRIGSFSITPDAKCDILRSVLRLFYPKMSSSISNNLAAFGTNRPPLEVLLRHNKMNKSWVIEHYAVTKDHTDSHDLQRLFWAFERDSLRDAIEQYVDILFATAPSKSVQVKRKIIELVFSRAGDEQWKSKMVDLMRIDDKLTFEEFKERISRDGPDHQQNSGTFKVFRRKAQRSAAQKLADSNTALTLPYNDLVDCLDAHSIDLPHFLDTIYPTLPPQGKLLALTKQVNVNHVDEKEWMEAVACLDLSTVRLLLDKLLEEVTITTSNETHVEITLSCERGTPLSIMTKSEWLSKTTFFPKILSMFGSATFLSLHQNSTVSYRLSFVNQDASSDAIIRDCFQVLNDLFDGNLPGLLKRAHDIFVHGHASSELSLGDNLTQTLKQYPTALFSKHLADQRNRAENADKFNIKVAFNDTYFELPIPSNTTCIALYSLLFCAVQDIFMITTNDGSLLLPTNEPLGHFVQVDEDSKEWIPHFGQEFVVRQRDSDPEDLRSVLKALGILSVTG